MRRNVPSRSISQTLFRLESLYIYIYIYVSCGYRILDRTCITKFFLKYLTQNLSKIVETSLERVRGVLFIHKEKRLIFFENVISLNGISKILFTYQYIYIPSCRYIHTRTNTISSTCDRSITKFLPFPPHPPIPTRKLSMTKPSFY